MERNGINPFKKTEMGGGKLQLFYLEDIEASKGPLLELYRKYYGENEGPRRLNERVEWYKHYEKFHLLVAVYDGEYVGQSCAYGVTAVVHGEENPLWWSVDTFVLSSMRGKGIGKALQEKLHHDMPNFSSAWYSSVNGVIKKKMGAKELFPVQFCYYPISKYLLAYAERCIRKLTGKEVMLSAPVKYIYTRFKTLRNKAIVNNEKGLTKEISDRFCKWLEESGKDFYIKRSWDFMRWKYIENPNLKYHILELSVNGVEPKGYVIFSEIHQRTSMGVKLRVSSLLDYVSSPDMDVSIHDIVLMVARFFKHSNIDGVVALGLGSYMPRYVEKPIPRMLSLLECGKIEKPYLSYIDQDMERM